MEASEGPGEAGEGALGRRGPGGLASQVGRGFEEGLAVSSFQCLSQVRKVNGSGVSIDSGRLLQKRSEGPGPVGTGMLSGSAGKWVQASVPEAARLDVEGHVV